MTTNTESPRPNYFGIVSLLLGTLTLMVCWVPYFGIIGLPISTLGLVLGLSGIVLSIKRGDHGIGISLAGTAVSGLATGIIIIWMLAIGEAASSEIKMAEQASCAHNPFQQTDFAGTNGLGPRPRN